MRGPAPAPPTPAFLYGSKAIFRKLLLPFLSTELHVQPLAEGYGFMARAHHDAAALADTLRRLILCNKTIVLEGPSPATVALIRDLSAEQAGLRVIELLDEQPRELTRLDLGAVGSFQQSTLFVITEAFILRRFLHQRAQEQNALVPLHAQLLPQLVRFVGIGPTSQHLTEEARAAIGAAEHVVLFDRTLRNIMSEVSLSGRRHVIRYDYDDYASNWLAVNSLLLELQIEGARNVVVLVEGSPEIYDLAEGLSHFNRYFDYTVAPPLVLIGCQWIEQEYGASFVSPSYVLTSGYGVRHGIMTRELIAEISHILATDLTIMIMEMYSGDLPLLFSLVRRSPRPKSMLMLTEMFSPEQRIWFLPFSAAGQSEWADRAKGRFTTLVIIDEARVSPESAAYVRMSETLGIGPTE